MNAKSLYLPIITLLITFLLSACDEQSDSSQSNDRIKIAVLSSSDFFPDRAVQQRMGLPEELAARIIEHLTISSRFQVLERTALRKIINEQQFGKESKDSFLDKTLNAAIDNLPDVDGLTVAVTTHAADSNDLIKEYQNLGSTMGADFLVFAVLEKVTASTKSIALPYSESKKTFTQNKVDARLRLRIINAKTGNIAGAASFRTQVKESLFAGQESTKDEYSTFDHLGSLAANKVLDITFPAKIVSNEPFVINRGSNDKYQAESIFKVVRETKEIFDGNNVSIGRVKTPVGSIKLTSVQDTLSVVEVVEGNIQSGDLLVIEETEQNKMASVPARTQYTEGKPSGKIRLAVGKIRINAIGSHTAFAERYRNRVKNDLLVKLTNSKRFDVLERQEVDQLLDEKSFAALTQGQSIESKLSEMTEADYLIITMVNDFYIKTEQQKIAYVDKIQFRHFGVIDSTLRIVDTHSGKLLAADKVRINKRIESNNNATDTLYSDMVDEFTSTLVSRIMLRLYPVKIIGAISNEDFYINRGADGNLNAGLIFDVMREGEEMFDPDTGISFGKVEQNIAQVSITNVEPSRSKVHLMSGSGIKNGDVLRLSKQVIKKAPKPQIRKPKF